MTVLTVLCLLESMLSLGQLLGGLLVGLDVNKGTLATGLAHTD
jgi:hypothetical protein